MHACMFVRVHLFATSLGDHVSHGRCACFLVGGALHCDSISMHACMHACTRMYHACMGVCGHACFGMFFVTSYGDHPAERLTGDAPVPFCKVCYSVITPLACMGTYRACMRVCAHACLGIAFGTSLGDFPAHRRCSCSLLGGALQQGTCRVS